MARMPGVPVNCPAWACVAVVLLAGAALAARAAVRRHRRPTVASRRGDFAAAGVKVVGVAARHGHRLAVWAARPDGYGYDNECARCGGEVTISADEPGGRVYSWPDTVLATEQARWLECRGRR